MSLTNSSVNTHRPPHSHPPLCPPNSLSCKDSVSLGRRTISEKVNSGWPSRLGQSGIPVEAPRSRRVPTSKGGRGDGLSQEFCPLTSGLHSWPQRSCLNIGQLAFFFFWLFKNQDSNLTLPPLRPQRWHQQSKPITRLLWLRRQVLTYLKKKKKKKFGEKNKILIEWNIILNNSL